MAVIFLNGSSSSGKTTLAQALQQVLPGAWQHMALDQFRDGLPGRYRGLNAPPGTPGDRGLNVVPITRDGERMTEIRFGDVGERALAGMRRAIAAFASMGNNIIVDDLLFKSDYLTDYVDVLRGIDVTFVGVRCPLNVVNEREAQRPGRFPGTATSHFYSVHDHPLAYDIEVDTSRLAPREAAEKIADALDRQPKAFASQPLTCTQA